MSKQALIYESARPVAKDRHGDWSVQRNGTYGFSRGLNAVPLTVAEFYVAAREFPIVFARNGDGYSASALLGLRDDENLFVDAAGKWQGRYVPAFLRRYPFVFHHDAGAGTYTLCIDEASELVSQKPSGERLFEEGGEETAFLKKMLDFTTSWQRAYQDTTALCERLNDQGLLEDREIRFDLPDGQKAATRGFAVVNKEKLAEIEPSTASEMLRNGDLARVHAQLLSLRNVEDLAGKIPRDDRVLN